MGNSCGCGSTPVVNAVIMGRMRANTERPLDYRTSYVVTTQVIAAKLRIVWLRGGLH